MNTTLSICERCRIHEPDKCSMCRADKHEAFWFSPNDTKLLFYPASAFRRIATPDDIIPGYEFTSYREAKIFVCNYGHDSDDVVFVKINEEWMLAWGYDKQGRLLVCKSNEGWIDSVPLEV